MRPADTRTCVSYAKPAYATGKPPSRLGHKLPPEREKVSITVRIPRALRDALRARGDRRMGDTVRKALEVYLSPPESCTSRPIPYAVMEAFLRTRG